MRSVSRLAAIAFGFTALAGCTTTQEKAARLQLNNARIRANLTPLRISARSSAVKVTSVSLLIGKGRPPAAVVATVRNQTSNPVSDLPLLVGIKLPSGQRMDVNSAAGLSYFRNHLPAIPARGELTWVLPIDRRLPAGARPFAEVGSANPATATPIPALPVLRVAPVKASRATATLTVQNSSSVTQYQLPVYAVARRGQRWVAAGQTVIQELDGGASALVRLPLVGNSSGAAVSFEAPPTIFK